MSFLPQFPSSECDSMVLSTHTSFNALMKSAYSQGPNTLLEVTFKENVDGALASMSMADFPVAIKQMLLYIKSTVENIGTVRAQNKFTRPYITKLKNKHHTSYPFPQFSKDTGTAPLKALMGILLDLVIKLHSFEESTSSEPAAENSPEGSNLFLEINQSSRVEGNKEKVWRSSAFT